MPELKESVKVKEKPLLKVFPSTTTALVGSTVQYDAYLSVGSVPMPDVRIDFRDEDGTIVGYGITDGSGHVSVTVSINKKGSIKINAEANLHD